MAHLCLVGSSVLVNWTSPISPYFAKMQTAQALSWAFAVCQVHCRVLKIKGVKQLRINEHTVYGHSLYTNKDLKKKKKKKKKGRYLKEKCDFDDDALFVMAKYFILNFYLYINLLHLPISLFILFYTASLVALLIQFLWYCTVIYFRWLPRYEISLILYKINYVSIQ